MTITLRRATAADAEALAKIHAGPQAIRGTLPLPFPVADVWRRRMEAEGTIYLLACNGDDTIGAIAITTFGNSPRRKHVGSIFMSVRDDWQGRGVGFQPMAAAVDLADRWLNLTRLELEVVEENEPSVGLYKKFGFEIEGTARQFAFRDGEYVDVYTMGRLRPAREQG